MVPPLSAIMGLLRRLDRDPETVSDSALLRRYVEQREEGAFEILLSRHGGMVWGVCRRVAPDPSAAEDAFQATVLSLARNARAIRSTRSVAGWLYRVAYRAALAVRSHPREQSVARVPDRPAPGPDPAAVAEARELAGVIDVAISELPDRFRLPLVLCELEGRSNAEAASVLGCPVGTIESRLTRARARLRDRLSRHGVTLSLGMLAADRVPGAVQAAALRVAADPTAASGLVRKLAAGAAGLGQLRTMVLLFAGLTALTMGLVVAVGLGPTIPPHGGADDWDRIKGPAEPVVFARLGSTRFRHPGPVFDVAFTPDGKTLATAALGNVSIWDTATGKLRGRLEQTAVPFHRVAFTADGKALYTIVAPDRDTCELRTLDPTTGQERGRVKIPNVRFLGAEFSADVTQLAVFCNQERKTVLFDLAAGKELVRVPGFWHGNGLKADDTRWILAGGNETVLILEATTGKERKLEPGERRPEWVRFTPGGAVLFVGHNWVERWDPERKKAIWKADFLPSGSGLEVSPNGSQVAHVSSFGVTVLDVENGQKVFNTWKDLGACSAARFAPDGQTLALACPSGVVALLEAGTGKPLAQSPDLPGWVSGLTFSHDNRYLVVAAGDRWVRWDLRAAVPSARPTPLAEFAVLSPGGRVAARPDTYEDADAPAEFVDAISGKRISLFDPPETGDTVIISPLDYRRGLFSGDGQRYVGMRRSQRGPGGQQDVLGLAVWDVATGKRLAQRNDGETVPETMAVSFDGKAAAVLNSNRNQLAMWEPDTGRTRWTLEVGSGLQFVAFTRGGDRLVIQEFYSTLPALTHFSLPPPPGPHPLRVLDAATGKEVLKANGPDLGQEVRTFAREAYNEVPNARALSPDGRTAAISAFDGTIFLWDLATDRARCRLAHPGPVHDLAFSPDGRMLAAASCAAPVIVYDLDGSDD